MKCLGHKQQERDGAEFWFRAGGGILLESDQIKHNQGEKIHDTRFVSDVDKVRGETRMTQPLTYGSQARAVISTPAKAMARQASGYCGDRLSPFRLSAGVAFYFSMTARSKVKYLQESSRGLEHSKTLREDREWWMVCGLRAGGSNRVHERTVISHDFPMEILEGGLRGQAVFASKGGFKCLCGNGLQVNPTKSNRHTKMISGSMASFNDPCGRALINFIARKPASASAKAMADREDCRAPRRGRGGGSTKPGEAQSQIWNLIFEKRPMKMRKLSQIKPNKTSRICDSRIAIYERYGGAGIEETFTPQSACGAGKQGRSANPVHLARAGASGYGSARKSGKKPMNRGKSK